MRVLLSGANGQLGQALMVAKPKSIELIACGRAELDLASPQACSEAVRFYRPDWVLNAGAYTAVDKAESEPELALAVNAGAPAALAEALAASGGRLLHVSTDFVFNGAQGFPYLPHQAVEPLGIYGISKARGEAAVFELLGPQLSCVLRTSWLYGPIGKNFCLTMLRLHGLKAESGEPLRVVADQVACPTHTAGLAEACWKVLANEVVGFQHWSDAGAASWYDFAVAIGELGVLAGLLERPALVVPITTAEYPTAARRPCYSLLDCSTSRAALGLEPVHWRDGLLKVLSCIGTSN